MATDYSQFREDHPGLLGKLLEGMMQDPGVGPGALTAIKGGGGLLNNLGKNSFTELLELAKGLSRRQFIQKATGKIMRKSLPDDVPNLTSARWVDTISEAEPLATEIASTGRKNYPALNRKYSALADEQYDEMSRLTKLISRVKKAGMMKERMRLGDKFRKVSDMSARRHRTFLALDESEKIRNELIKNAFSQFE